MYSESTVLCILSWDFQVPTSILEHENNIVYLLGQKFCLCSSHRLSLQHTVRPPLRMPFQTLYNGICVPFQFPKVGKGVKVYKLVRSRSRLTDRHPANSVRQAFRHPSVSRPSLTSVAKPSSAISTNSSKHSFGSLV